MKANFALPVKMADEIDPILTHLQRMTEAECVLLADISGQLISMVGRLEESDPVLVAALAAGDVAAMAELNRQIGEEDPSGSFLHEGEHKSIYLCYLANTFILIVIFRTETPAGLVRLFTGRSVEKLAPLAEQFEQLAGQPRESASTDFSAALSDELEKAFNQL